MNSYGNPAIQWDWILGFASSDFSDFAFF